MKNKITTKKYQGDDKYSWAVLLDGRPMYTGLGQNELAYYKKLVQERVQKQSKVV